jgi:hypothetical protein
MIRDLRAMGAAPRLLPLPDAEALAFARDRVARSDTSGGPPRSGRAFTIAVTAPRTLECKRGFAAHLAAHLAAIAGTDAPVCVVDLDTESRDIGTRFAVHAPVLLDLAKSTNTARPEALANTLARVGPLAVLPTRLPDPPLVPLLRSKTPRVLATLADAFDVIVLDAPVAVGVGAPSVDRAVLEHVDVVLAAVTADAAALGGALRYLNALSVGVDHGLLPSNFETYLVLTGSDHDGTRTLGERDDLAGDLRELPVLGRVPQTWGRRRPDGPFDPNADARVNDAFAALIDVLVS